MNALLWVLQVFLAVLFFAHGWADIFPPASMREVMEDSPLPRGFFYFVGTAEILGAIGLTLPGLLSIFPGFTPLAAVGLAIVMFGAVLYHFSRRELVGMLFTAVLLALLLFVAYMRWLVHPL